MVAALMPAAAGSTSFRRATVSIRGAKATSRKSPADALSKFMKVVIGGVPALRRSPVTRAWF